MVQGVEIKNDFIQNTNPASGELILPLVKVTTSPELAAVLKAASSAQPAWAALDLSARVKRIRAGLASLEPQADELAALITEEMGKVMSESREEVGEALGLKGSWLGMVEEANKEVCFENDSNSQSIVVRDPLGVVAVISPWNYPVGEIPLLALPALVAGNTVVVKPSEVTPLSAQRFCKTLADSLPEGVLQVVHGDGRLGSELVSSPDVKMVCMTGSTETGKKIASACASDLKRLILELGGKDPLIVFSDADLEKAARDTVAYSLANAGQVCCAVERVFVDEGVKARFEKKVVAYAREWKVGPPTEETSKLGPMVSHTQLSIVEDQVKHALDVGARMLYESEIPEDKKGNWAPVRVMTDLDQSSMRILKQETFGPGRCGCGLRTAGQFANFRMRKPATSTVICLASFDGSEDEAVRLANDSCFGLCSYVYSNDVSKAARVGRRINSGQIGINCYSLACAQPQCPWVSKSGDRVYRND